MSTPTAQLRTNDALTATATGSGYARRTASGSVSKSASGMAAARGPATWPAKISASATIARIPASTASMAVDLVRDGIGGTLRR